MTGSNDPQPMSGVEEKSFKLQADMDGPLVDYADKGYTVEYLGEEDVEGTPAHKLRLVVDEEMVFESRAGDRFVFVNMTAFSCSVESYNSDSGGTHTLVELGNMAIQSGKIEMSVPLSALNPPQKSYVSAWNDTDGAPIDDTYGMIAVF